MILDIALTLFLVLLNGFFVAAEFAIVKVRTSQLELRIRAGSRLAKLTKKIVSQMDAYLSATQLGITLASLGLGWIGESVVAKIIMSLFDTFGVEVEPGLAHNIALPAAFATITFLHIVFGELAPKSLAIQASEKTSLFVAVPMRIFYILFRPFIWVLNSFANLIIRMLGFESVAEEEELHSADELRYLLEESSKSGIIDTEEHKLLDNVFEFRETPVKQIMVPRGKITGVDISLSPEDIMERFIEEGYSRLPVYDKSIDSIKGIIYAKDMIMRICHPNLIHIVDIIRPAYYVQEEDHIYLVLQDMQSMRVHMAVVLDEFGGIAGLLTLEDIIEEIFGEIQDEYDEETPVVKEENSHTFIVDASAPIDDANDFLPYPLPESDDYETVGGLIMDKLGRIPDTDEAIELENYLCKILDRSERTIESVKLFYQEPEDNSG